MIVPKSVALSYLPPVISNQDIAQSSSSGQKVSFSNFQKWQQFLSGKLN
jgi:hypothetical protein